MRRDSARRSERNRVATKSESQDSAAVPEHLQWQAHLGSSASDSPGRLSCDTEDTVYADVELGTPEELAELEALDIRTGLPSAEFFRLARRVPMTRRMKDRFFDIVVRATRAHLKGQTTTHAERFFLHLNAARVY